MKEPRQERSRESADRVLDVALRMLASDGPSGLTMAGVASSAGVSNGSLFHRFRSRADLIGGAFDRFTQGLRSRAQDFREAVGVPENIDEALSNVVAGYLMIFLVEGGLIQAFVLEALSDPVFAARGHAEKEVFVELLQAVLGPWLPSGAETVERLRVVHRILFGYCLMRSMFEPEELSAATHADALRDAARGALKISV